LVRTDIAGFLGFTERGPLPEDFLPATFEASRVALKITSWKEFQAKFGGFIRYGYLAYAVRAFFENGGDTCYVVRVAATTAQSSADQPASASYALASAPATLLGALGQIISEFQAEFKPSRDVFPSVGDRIRIEGAGITVINHVAAILKNGQIQFASKLDPKIPVGAVVSRFPTAFTVSASSRGNWGNRIRLQINPLDRGTFSLRAFIDLGSESRPTEEEFYRRLTLANRDADNYAPIVLQQRSNLVRIEQKFPSNIDFAVNPEPLNGVYLQGGRDGLSQVTSRDFTGSSDDRRGLRLLEEIEDVAILAVPDSVYQGTPPLFLTPPPPDRCQPLPVPKADPSRDDPTAEPRPLSPGDSLSLQREMIDQCERLRYRVALIDPPDKMQIGEMQRWPKDRGLVMRRSSRFAAIYYPWLKVPDPLKIEGLNRRVPPSGHVAGTYAQTDLTYGVQRPPANVELEFVTDLGQSISDLQQEGLNENSVNAIRAFPGRGIRIWGTRSLAPAEDSDWRFIHVRRLMSAIEETVEHSSRWAVFQNNDVALRNSLKHSLEVLLQGFWTKGGLKGGKPADAFYVKCDANNNPQYVIDQGQLICEVGVAVAAPMEFIVFEIRQDASGSRVLDS
jgi:Bacteriophage tail sheath protein